MNLKMSLPVMASDLLRRCARCTKCGHKGAELKAPSWVGNGFADWQPFSADVVLP
jgi:hypothetical protein